MDDLQMLCAGAGESFVDNFVATMNLSRFAGFVVHAMLSGTGHSLKEVRLIGCASGI
jgi:hypothetical protein